MNIGELYVKLNADPSGVERGVGQAQQKLGGFANAAKAAGVALAGAFAAKKVIDFGRDAIATFSEAEAVWNRLEGTLDTVGVSFDDVSDEIKGAAAEMQRLTTVGDEDFAATLQALTAISGDYAASLKNVQTVADVAAGANISLDAAAQLVGKAMAGNTASLSRYGIVVEEGADAIDVLRDKFKGMAENEANTLQGKTKQLSNAWGDFKEAIGAALAAAGGSGDILGTVTAGIQSMTAWVERNEHQIKGLADALVMLGSFAVTQIGYAVEGFNTMNAAVGWMVDGVQAAFSRLTASFDWVTGKVEAVTGAFRDMYQKVVGGSYVPDMIDGIAVQFGRLDAVMVQPVVQAVARVETVVERMARNNRERLEEQNRALAATIQQFRDLGGVLEMVEVRASSAGAAVAGVGGGGMGGMLGGFGGIAGILGSLNPMNMMASMAMGAAQGLIRKGIGSIFGGIFGGGRKEKPATAIPQPPRPAPRTGAASGNVPGGYDVDAARRGVMGGGGLHVHIHNPPPAMNVVAVTKQVKEAILEMRRRGDAEWNFAVGGG